MNVSDVYTIMKKNTGRKKIPIKKIEETTSRQVTFSKRRTGLFKKASELCVLTGAEMAILVQSPGGHCYAFGHPSVDAVIDRYMNNTNDDNNASMSSKQPSLTEDNQHYAELSMLLEMEKRKHGLIQQEKIGNSSGIPWYEQDIEGMEVEELEQYLAALVELKRKVLVRADDLANMETASMLSLGPRMWNNLPNTFDNAPLNMQAFGDGIKINGLDFGDGIKIENNTMNGQSNGQSNGLDFGDGIKFENNTMNGPSNGLDFGDGTKIMNNTMNGPTNGLDFEDGIKFDNNTMNGPTYGLDFGDGIKFEKNTMNGLDFGDGIKFENNTMNGRTSNLDFGDGIKIMNNTMDVPANGLDFGDGIKFQNNAIIGPTNGLDFGDGNNRENNMMNGPTNDHLNFGDLGLDLDNLL